MSDALRDLELPDDLSAQAVPLAGIGLAEVAWPRAAALTVIGQLAGRPVAVLGGDVLRMERGRPAHTYDSWHADPTPGEGFAAYAARSQVAARRYVEEYPERGSPCVYVLVLADRLPPPVT